MPARIELDKTFSDELSAAVRHVFKEIFGANVQLAHTQTGAAPEPSVAADVSAIVPLVQTANEGNLILAFPQEVICHFLAQTYGRSFAQIDQTVKEGAGELANMVYGQLKLRLNQRGYDLQMALPNVIVGAQHSVYSIQSSRALIAQFSAGSREFTVAVILNGEGK